VVIPGVNFGLLVPLSWRLRYLQGDEVVERMNIARNHLRNRPRFGPVDASAGGNKGVRGECRPDIR
jgi:hypothetical protein